jgi:diguanylate cyclase (GGDEF)-like protein/PAS domain S-box-containing protein
VIPFLDYVSVLVYNSYYQSIFAWSKNYAGFRMKISQKVVVIVSSIIVVYTIAVFVVLKLYVGSHFDAMELSEAGKDMSRARSLVEREIKAVGQYGADYARWDDTYKYITSGSREYISVNYNYTSMKSQNISYVCILDGKQRILFNVLYDQQGIAVPFKDMNDMSSPLRDVIRIIIKEKKESVQGLINTSYGLMIVSAYKITDSQMTKYPNGILIAGRIFGGSESSRISDMLKSEIRMHDALDKVKLFGVSSAIAAPNGEYLVKNGHTIEIFSVFIDILANPVTVLSLKRTMMFSIKGRLIVNIAVLILFGCGIVVLGSMIVILKKGIVRPLEKIEADTRKIALSENFSRKLSENRGDEIGVLAKTFNQLIGKLYDINSTLEKRVVERTSELAAANAELVLLAKVFESSLEGILITDEKGVFEKINPAFTKISGFTIEDTIGKEIWMMKSDRHSDKFYNDIKENVRSEGRWSGEIWAMNKRCRVYPQWTSISTIKNEDGKITNFIGIFHDISELKRQESYIKYQAYHDMLTGLPNRVLLLERMRRAIERNKEIRKKFAILFLDLDRFKNINDSMGHEYGDILLQHVSERLEKLARISDTIARLGGDEFIIMLEDFDDDNHPAILAERIIESFKNPFVIRGQMFNIGTSIGISIYPEDGTECGILMRNADIAMYRAKDEGRLRYCHFTSSLNERVSSRVRLENELRIALVRKEFDVYFQPILNLSEGIIDRFEALVRWNHDGKMVSPCEFIPVAEETGIVAGIDLIVMEKAFQKIKILNKNREIPYSVALNISMKTIMSDDFIEILKSSIENSDISNRWFSVEISLKDYLDEPAACDTVIKKMNEIGVSLSLDDFGSGHFSITHILDSKITSVKIDRSFIRNIDNGNNDDNIFDRIIKMTRDHGIMVTASGIETPAQFKYIQDLGCNFAQGYFISEPVPFERAVQLIESYRLIG